MASPYAQIKNKRLRELVMNSESIRSQSEKELEDMVLRIARLPEKGQMAMVATLEEEEKQILQAKIRKMKDLKRNLTNAIRKENERVEMGETEEEAEALLKQNSI